LRKARIFFLQGLIKEKKLCGHRNLTINKPKIISLLQRLAVIKRPFARGTEVFPTASPLRLSSAHWERAAGENVMASQVMMWISSCGNITEHRKPNPVLFLIIPQTALQTYTIGPRGFHARAMQDSCSFHNPACQASWIRVRIHPGSISCSFLA